MTATAAEQISDTGLVRRVRWRLLAWSGGTTLVVLVLLGALIYVAVARSLEAAAVEQLRDRATLVERALAARGSFALPPTTIIAPQPGVVGISLAGGPVSGTIAFLVDPAGDVFPDVGRALGIPLPHESAMEAARTNSTILVQADVAGTPMRILSEPIDADALNRPLVVQVLTDRTAEQRTLAVLLTVLAVGGLAVLLVSLGVGWVYADRALVPIRDALRRQREFAADASHELRTPLAIVRGSVEYLRRHAGRPVDQVETALEDIDAEVDRLAALVDDLLLLARTDSGQLELRPVATDLADIALDASAGLARLAEPRGVRVEVDARPVPVTADPDRLRQLVRILGDNAIARAPTGSTVTVAAGNADGTAHLVVEDSGPGFAAEHLPHVFDRFWRGPNGPATGTGLGLAIAAWIVERHGGTISASNRPDGGARIEVRLPAA